MPGQFVAAGHLPDRHDVDVTDQLAGQTTGHMGAASQDDLGMVLPVPLSAPGADEPASHPFEFRRPAPGRKIETAR